MKKNSLLSGALILVVGAVLAKGFSAVYRILLTRILGGVGIGLYQLIFPIYSLCVVLATAGLPMAISKIIAKNKGGERKIVKKCMFYIATISLILALIMAFGSRFLAILQGNKEIAICYVILAPSLLFVAGSSVLRGYFQGVHNFTPSAVSNIIEQFVKLCFGLVLSLILIKQSLMLAIIGAVVGIVISEIIAFIILVINYKISIKKSTNIEIELTFKEIFKDILPITLTNIILPLSSFIDSVLVVNLLKINFSTEVSVFLYGIESGAVASLINLPTIFSFAIASAIMPSMSVKECIKNKNFKLNVCVKVVLMIAVPCVVSFIFFPKQIISVLYGNRLDGFGFAGVDIAARLLAISSFGIIGLVVNQVYSSTLQAVNFRKATITNLAIAVFTKFVITLMFMPFKNLNIYALAIANTTSYLLVMLLNQLKIQTKFNLKIDYKFYSKLILSNFIMLVTIATVLLCNSSIQTIVLAFILGGLLNVFSLYMFKIFNKKDYAMLKYKTKN